MAHAPLLWRVRLLAVKTEAAPGTAEVLAGADAALNVFEAKAEQGIAMAEREGQGGRVWLPHVPEHKMGRITFKMEMNGGSAQPATMNTLLPACGLGFSVTKYLIDKRPPDATSSSQKTVTMALYENGVFKQIYGAQGNVKFLLEAGKRVLMEFNFLGIWSPPSDVGILGPTYPTLAPLRWEDGDFTIGAWTPQCSKLELDLNNQLEMRENQETATGLAYAVIANAHPSGRFDPEADLIATKDVEADWLAGTEANIAFKPENGAATATFSATKCVFTDPKEDQRHGILVHDLGFELNADDLQIIFA